MLLEGHCCAGLNLVPSAPGQHCAFRLTDIPCSVWQACIHAFLLDNFLLAVKLLSMLHTMDGTWDRCACESFVLATQSHGVLGQHDKLTASEFWSCRLVISNVYVLSQAECPYIYCQSACNHLVLT